MHIRLTPLAAALRPVVIGLAIASCSPPLLAADIPSVGYDIAPGNLDQVLGAFGQQSGTMIAVDSNLTQSLRSPGLKGRFAVSEGLQRLLAPLGLVAVKEGEGYRVQVASQVASAPLQLGTTSVIANQLGTVTEGTGSYTPGTIATATRLVLTPRETPQSISVVTRQVIDDFGLNSIDDVMRHTPGITVSTYDSERTNYYARGFSIQSFQYDGIPTTRSSAYSAGHTLTDMAIYDRVEVLKGASGLLTGAGGPGGTINLVRKKPTSEFKGHIDLGAGSWNNYRSEIDLSGPLTETGNVRGRAVAAYQDKQSFMDHYQRKTSVYYGILEMDLTPDTLLTLGADYQDNNPRGSSWSGSQPLYDASGNALKMSRSFNNGAKWSRWEQYTRTVFATLEHSFANGWVAKGQYNHQLNGYDAPLGSITPDDPVIGSIYANKFTGETTSDSLDAYISGPFSFAGLDHEMVIGTSASRSHWKGKDYGAPTYFGNAYDFFSWNGKSIEPDWGSPTSLNDEVTRQTGIYMTGRFSLMDDLKLLLGTRIANYQVTGTSDAKDSGKVIPYAGLTYDLDDHFSLYASYSEIFLPQTQFRDRNKKMIEPNEGKNYEVGIKGEFFDGRLNSSLAYFELHEENRAIEDLDFNKSQANMLAYKPVTAKTKGYEAEISGELMPNWQVQAGYTHKIMRDKAGQKVSTWEPEDQLNFYTTYKLSGPLDKLTLGGGARWQGEGWQMINNKPKKTQEKLSQDPYWLVDLMARYQITENLSTSLNVYNVFDKRYYTNIGFFESAYYGDPRNVMVSTRWNF
ncbi:MULTISPECIES: TonB-dependent siderophore receptor [unclassified Pseudomonas]|uniref:TonB-dependent siderophore receptor n=1 Tax=unclassified Pseudomonas TaxID=196821 RepID=UPI000CD217BD|nr:MULTISPECIES: TonB-dependent siderophore receptor [unclassified Pseudomonas]POA57429.1 TonB-dependent siderophore receptor [Pseudomonas sp. FW507-12TSA]